MPDQPNGRNEAELSVGRWLSARVAGTKDLVILVMLALTLGLSLWMDYRDRARIAEERANEHRAILSLQRAQIKAIRTQNWLLSLPLDKRPRLPRPPEADEFLDPCNCRDLAP